MDVGDAEDDGARTRELGDRAAGKAIGREATYLTDAERILQ